MSQSNAKSLKYGILTKNLVSGRDASKTALGVRVEGIGGYKAELFIAYAFNGISRSPVYRLLDFRVSITRVQVIVDRVTA